MSSKKREDRDMDVTREAIERLILALEDIHEEVQGLRQATARMAAIGERSIQVAAAAAKLAADGDRELELLARGLRVPPDEKG